ncbi:hypothetical protein [Mucilaginibacter defluvii]|uniref:Apea-like HEPN domain-containing protein n=1 Tax=Mucilaginibacter defluvii TaxID=1196019 RepID=A0ABP9G4N8_9SPHI
MSKNQLVYCIHPEQYDVFDTRINKPVWHRKLENGVEVGSMVLQELDIIPYSKNPFEFFAPNNVGMLLSISQKYRDQAKELYTSAIDPKLHDHSVTNAKIDKKKFLQEKSKEAANYIELIQIAVVFAYTAVESFVNLSIPDDYKYEVHIKNKGITEIYNKTAIERWISLNDKLANILTVIYKTRKIESEKFWSNFKSLEKLRHNIIHQKSIDRTEFYKDYFMDQIFKIVDSGLLMLQFFYDAHASENRSNPLWPWGIGKEKSFPVINSFDSKDFEVIGNLYQGRKSKEA